MGWQRMGLDKSHPLRPLWLQVGNAKRFHRSCNRISMQGHAKKGARSEHVQDSLQFAPKTPQDVEPDVNSKSLRPREFTMQYGSKFEGKLLHDLIFVEICAGSARLTKAARDAGFNGIAVDHTHQRSCGIDICIFELEDQDQVNDLCQFWKLKLTASLRCGLHLLVALQARRVKDACHNFKGLALQCLFL